MKTIDDYIEEHEELVDCFYGKGFWAVGSRDVEKIMKEFARDIIKECANRAEAVSDSNGNAIPATKKIMKLINELD